MNDGRNSFTIAVLSALIMALLAILVVFIFIDNGGEIKLDIETEDEIVIIRGEALTSQTETELVIGARAEQPTESATEAETEVETEAGTPQKTIRSHNGIVVTTHESEIPLVLPRIMAGFPVCGKTAIPM